MAHDELPTGAQDHLRDATFENSHTHANDAWVPWTWLPTSSGAVRRSLVLSMYVERQDGEFEEGATSIWFVHVHTAVDEEPIRLRPVFYDASELRWWVDQVFPGACFGLLPPDVASETEAEVSAPNEAFLAARWVPDAGPGPGGRLAAQIRAIGEGMYGGDAYTPPQGYRPPPGVHIPI